MVSSSSSCVVSQKVFSENIIKSCMFKSVCVPYLECTSLQQAGLDPAGEELLFEEESVVVGKDIEQMHVTFQNDAMDYSDPGDKTEEQQLIESVQDVLFK